MTPLCEAVSENVHRCDKKAGHAGPHHCDWLKVDRKTVCDTEWTDVPVGFVEVSRGPAPFDSNRGEA